MTNQPIKMGHKVGDTFQRSLTSSPLRLSRSSASDAIFDYVLLTKEITGSDTTNVATGEMVYNLDTKIKIPKDKSDLWTQGRGIGPQKGLLNEFLGPENFIHKSFPQLTPLNLMRSGYWCKKNQNPRCRKFKIVNNNDINSQNFMRLIIQFVDKRHFIKLN